MSIDPILLRFLPRLSQYAGRPVLSPSFLYIRPATRSLVVRSCTVPLHSGEFPLQLPENPSVFGYSLKTDLCQPFNQDRYSIFLRFSTAIVALISVSLVAQQALVLIGSKKFAKTSAPVRAHRPDYSEISPRNKSRH